MSEHAFDPNCRDCRPRLIDKSCRRVPDDDARMVAINRVWDSASLEEQTAFHRCTVHNSRDKGDLALSAGLMDRMKAALDQLARSSPLN